MCASIPDVADMQIASCCNQIVGCTSCVQTWFGSKEPHTCPNCRQENIVVTTMQNVPKALKDAVAELAENDGEFSLF